MSFRIEKDSLGDVQVPADAYWGSQAERTRQLFQISGLTEHPKMIDAFVMLKKAATEANTELGLLDKEIGDPSFFQRLAITHPTLISNVPVFLRDEHAARMAEIIGAIETIAKLEPYREAALQSAPAISRFNPGPVGVFMGYDFHLGADGPKLIEINTNAGGALINAFVSRAQKACCTAVENVFPGQFGDHAADAIFMEDFYSEWRRQRGDQPLAVIAIVD